MIDLKPFIKTLDGKPIAVFGLALSGFSVIQAFAKADVQIYAYDDNEERLEEARKLGAITEPLTSEVLAQCAFLVLSPGVPLHHPEPHGVVRAAREVECDIIGDVELFYRALKLSHSDHTIIGLTGTNGKSTSTSLIAHILQENSKNIRLGGNIGMPVFDLKKPQKATIYVLEMSSYQLDLCLSFKADIGLILNITPDHLDRHGDMEGYKSSKATIVKGDTGQAILGIDDEYTVSIFETLKVEEEKSREAIPISVTSEPKGGVYVQRGVLIDCLDEDPVEIGTVGNIRALHGLHNHQNAAAAYAVCRSLGLEADAIFEAMKTYPGLPHRQYPVRVINGVAYINDSKATNAEATSKALSCYNNAYWIVGGKPKDGGLEGLEAFKDRVRHAFLIGEAAEDFAKWFDQYGIEYDISKTLDVAVTDAHRKAQDERGKPGGTGTVLFSPACASFDQYESFEKRGDHFVELVDAIPEEEGSSV